MWRNFRGTLSSHDLPPTDVEGEFEETTGAPAPPHGVRIRWTGAHQFQVGQTYRLELEGGPRFYGVTVTSAGAGAVVEFMTD